MYLCVKTQSPLHENRRCKTICRGNNNIHDSYCNSFCCHLQRVWPDPACDLMMQREINSMEIMVAVLWYIFFVMRYSIWPDGVLCTMVDFPCNKTRQTDDGVGSYCVITVDFNCNNLGWLVVWLFGFLTSSQELSHFADGSQD